VPLSSLTYLSGQPMRLHVWDSPSLGIHVSYVGFFHSASDGEEMHIYLVFNSKYFEGCATWTKNQTRSSRPLERSTRLRAPRRVICVYGRKYCEHARVRCCKPMFSKACRMRDVQMIGQSRRLFEDIPEDDYVRESIQGMHDVSRHQLAQGALGYMLRVAKLSAMCFIP
jgi:hypothetical protein